MGELGRRVVFESWRKAAEAEPEIRTAVPEFDPALRDERDPDPMVEDMVARLREGLSTLIAIDEWGRPIAWRNVVRLALGPVGAKLRDTEQALELAVAMIPAPEPAPAPVPDEPVVPAAAVDTAPAPEAVVEAPPVASAAPVDEVQDAPAPAAEHMPAHAVAPTVEVILPREEASEPEVVAPPAPAPVPSSPVVSPASAVPGSAGSLFFVVGDRRPVAPTGPAPVVGSGSPESTVSKYDRFLTSLYGHGKNEPTP